MDYLLFGLVFIYLFLFFFYYFEILDLCLYIRAFLISLLRAPKILACILSVLITCADYLKFLYFK